MLFIVNRYLFGERLFLTQRPASAKENIAKVDGSDTGVGALGGTTLALQGSLFILGQESTLGLEACNASKLIMCSSL